MSTACQATAPDVLLADIAGKYLTFRLGPESYAIKVTQVREIIRFTAITAVPQMPHHIKGVINLRGRIILVMDLRLKLGLEARPDDDQTCIVVVQLGGGAKPIGVVVDAVEEVASIAATDAEPAPEFGGAMAGAGILGMAKIRGAVKTLLDIDQVVGRDALDMAMPAFG